MTDEPVPTGDEADAPNPSDDRLRRLRDQLDAVDEIPVEERVPLFDRANRALVAELDALEEV